VAFALIDAAFLADSKFRRLRKRLPEPKDFNSAVGAWLIVLTSARRNGLPNVDAGDEAEDVTFLPDLIAVGLLTENGVPEGPFRAWAPRRQVYPSDNAPNAPNAPSAPLSTDYKPSTPLYSTPNVKGPRARFSTVDNSPTLRAIREEQRQHYAAEDAKPTIEPLPKR
jgi:hypothetical protein